MPIDLMGALGLGANVLGTVGNVFSGIFGGRSHKTAQDEANAMNYRMMKENMAYQTSEREAVQRYNLPSVQRKRFEDAGINPYMMLGQMDAGNASMQTGVSQPNAEASPDLSIANALQAGSQGVQSSVTTLLTQDQMRKQNDAIGLDNRLKAITLANEGQRQLLELESKRAEIANKRMDQASKQQQLDYMDDQIWQLRENNAYLSDYLQSRNDNEREEALLKRSERVLNRSKWKYQEKMNDWFDTLNEAQLQAIKASINETYSRINLNHKMSKTEVKKAALLATQKTVEKAKKKGIDIDNKNRQKLFDANYDYIKACTDKTRHSDNVIQNYSPLVSAGAGLGAAGIMKGW